MITVKDAISGREFNLRVAGVLIRENKVLLQRNRKGDAWVFPGGRAEVFEETAATVIREFQEELDVRPEVDRMLWVIENFQAYGVRHLHDIGIYYLVHTERLDGYLAGREFFREDRDVQLTFKWVDIGELNSIKLYPRIAGKLFPIQMDQGIRHYINMDGVPENEDDNL